MATQRSNHIDFDILVIGSGAGGGTVAKELSDLCDKGYRIGLLEWGARFLTEHHNRDEFEMARHYYFDQGGFTTESQDMTLAFAKSVGGSTSVYTGTSLKAPADVFDRWGVKGINREELDPRYDKYIKENNVHFSPSEDINQNNRLFEAGCREQGYRVEQFPLNTKDCQGLATCNLGCASGAKQGTSAVQIPRAEKNGVELIHHCQVKFFQYDIKAKLYEVYAEIHQAQPGFQPSRFEPGKVKFRTKKLVMAGGAINSSALMLHSIGRKRLPQIGKYFTCHPALILAGKHPQSIQNMSGHPKCFYSDEFSESDHFVLETCIYFPFVLSKSLTGYGQEFDEFMDSYAKLQMILVLAIDEAESHNRVEVNSNGSPRVHYKFSERTLNSFVSSIRASANIFFSAGADAVHAPATDRFLINRAEKDDVDQLIQRKHLKLGKTSIAAAHLMGGCKMGTDRKDSVTNSWGKVHEFEGLYVADSSLFPKAAEINPYLTIMALADRTAEQIRNDLGEAV